MLLLRKISELTFSLIETLLRNLSGNLGRSLRRFYYSRKFASCGENLIIDEGVVINGAKNIYIGDNVWIDRYCILIAGKVNFKELKVKKISNKDFLNEEGELHIGSDVHLAPQCVVQSLGGIQIGDEFTASAGCKIYSLSNDVGNCFHGTHSKREIAYVLSPIVIKKNVWVGLNSCVLGGTIESNSFIAPNSVVLTNLEENSFAIGNPAKKVKERFKR